MKILVIGSEKRIKKYKPKVPMQESVELIYASVTTTDEELLRIGSEADFIIVDAIAKVSSNVIQHMPNLKMIHSEGVAYNGIDIAAAKERGVYVCNNKGVNAGAVAEQTILLMLALLRNLVNGYEAVKNGCQIKVKEEMIMSGINELSDCNIGLVGFGDIGKAVAKRLKECETNVYYYAPHRRSVELENEDQVTYLALDELLAKCDIISLHVPVTPETEGFVNKEFLEKMKRGSYLINTSRGELMNDIDVCAALLDGTLKGAGFDTLAPEPVQKDHPLLNLPIEVQKRVIISPHIAGVTNGVFYKAHKNIWENIRLVSIGEKPNNIVNR